MAKKIIIILFFITLLIIPAIYASTQKIIVDTRPNHRILISVYKSGVTPAEKIISYPPYKDTGAAGEVLVILTTTEKKVDIKVDVKKDDIPLINHNFEEIPITGETIYISLFPPDNMTFIVGSPVQNITPNITTVNSTKNESSNIVSNVSNITSIAAINNVSAKPTSNFSITGYAAKFYNDNSKTFFYIFVLIGLLIGILIILFIIKRIPKKEHYTPAPQVYTKAASNHTERSLAEAERKLRIAQEDIERIKNRNQSIREAERKLEEDRIRLDKLKRGY